VKEVVLDRNWLMQSSEKLAAYGEKISTIHFTPEHWLPVTVPGTVVGGLVENNVLPDPFYGTNLREFPGFKRQADAQFANHFRPDDSPYRRAWWYRTEFDLPASAKNKRVWLQLRGVNYYAEVWFNGKRIADMGDVRGTYRLYEFDATTWALAGAKNVLALEVRAPQPDDLSLTFIDWNPAPPDDSMGIWQPVSWSVSGPVALRQVYVRSKLDVKAFKTAALTVVAELWNASAETQVAWVKGMIERVRFREKFMLKPFERKAVTIAPRDCRALVLKNPRVWWPHQLGKPELYKLSLTCTVDDKVSDRDEVSFGIRDIKTRVNKYTAREVLVNGRPLFVRGATWAPDLLLRQSRERDEADVRYVKNMNLNVVRFEGKFGSDHFWDLCDQEGVLIMAGWPCCNHWEKWKNWKESDRLVAAASQRTQLLRLRRHPSLMLWLNGSDFAPPPEIERLYLDILKEVAPDVPAASSGFSHVTPLTGDSGMKMGPYSYAPPVYWYSPRPERAASRYDSEAGPNMCIPHLDSLKKFLPPDQQHVDSEAWLFHTGRGKFNNTAPETEGITRRFGGAADLAEYSRLSQVLGYEAWRGMYEAYIRNYPQATGIIGWMLNSCWPNLIWHLYDYNLLPVGGFYGTQAACEPLHVQYAYDDAAVWLMNNTLRDEPGLIVTARVFDFNLQEKSVKTVRAHAAANSKQKLVAVERPEDISPVYFVLLTAARGGRLISRNFYWLSTAPDVFDDEKEKWCYKPLAQAADFSILKTLPRAAVETAVQVRETGGKISLEVTLTNTSTVLAFFMWIKAEDEATGEWLRPVYWNANCVSLMPGEVIIIKGMLEKKLVKGKVRVVVEGWNV
jgi:exo-1,4-beta-D-glucosaminidase